MRYQSTRGGVKGVSFSEVLLSSYAPDGGLYVPESLPQVTRELLLTWAGLGYEQLTAGGPLALRLAGRVEHGRDARLASLFTPTTVVKQICNYLYLFAGILEGVYDKFDTPQVVPVIKVGPVHVAETWHGPTGVFKDLTLPTLTRLCNHFLEKQGRKATILVSTMGDTGGATIHSALGMKNLRVIVAYPRHTVSHVQELQMTTTGAKNAIVFSHEGISDDLDLILKRIFTDPIVRKVHILLSFNSIHTVRVILNIVHYVYTYLRLVPNADEEVLVSVPTGGMGNAVGGFMAARMGLPIRILSAVNENDVVHRAFTLGDFSITKPQIATYAMSLDSLLPHNIERIFFYALEGDCSTLKKVMLDFEQKQKSVLPGKILENTRHFIQTATVDMQQCLETMERVWREYDYALCPHTAVAWKPAVEYILNTGDGGLKDYSDQRSDETGRAKCDKVIVVSTAIPGKFPDTLQKASVPVRRVDGGPGRQGGGEDVPQHRRELGTNTERHYSQLCRLFVA